LKKLRVAGNAISRETLSGIAGQTQLEELFLQDTVINDDDLAVILPAMPDLKRLTLRRCMFVTDQAAELMLAQNNLRNPALIEMNVGRKTLETLAGSQTMTALDLRDCSRLTPNDYALLVKMPQLVDLKIGGFGIDDSVLEHVSLLPNLSGLTVEDAMISPDAFARMIETAAWKGKLTQLVLSRNTMLFDAGISPIQNLPKLRRLTVNGMMITGTFLAQMAENESTRPKLESLSLRKAFLTVEGAKALQQYSELKSLDLSGVAMTEELVEIIAMLDTLETLNLTECRLTDEMVKPVRNMPNVKSLVLADNPMTNP
jgi:Leucine-rich repeat (LRR) protein